MIMDFSKGWSFDRLKPHYLPPEVIAIVFVISFLLLVGGFLSAMWEESHK